MRSTRVYRILGLSALMLNAGSPSRSVERTNTGTPGASQPILSECALPSGWDQVAARRPRFVVFGEIHGTRQAPELVGSIACALASRGKRVLVALELDASDNVRLQTAWKSTDRGFEQNLLKAGWAGRDDGVASVAMKDMLVRLHRSAVQGAQVSVVAFNGYANAAQEARLGQLPGQQGHEIGQAENIRAAALRKKYDIVLVLVGNVHARKTEVRHGGHSFKPMAMILDNSSKIIALNMVTSGGSAWNCVLDEKSKIKVGMPLTEANFECGVHPYHADDKPPVTFPSVGLGSFGTDTDSANYDGYFWIGPVSGSPPAVESTKE